MDFQKAERPLEDSRVYILLEYYWNDPCDEILAVFATKEAAEIALRIYEERAQRRGSYRGWCYRLEEREVLDQAPISEGQRPKTTAMGEGHDPSDIPPTTT